MVTVTKEQLSKAMSVVQNAASKSGVIPIFKSVVIAKLNAELSMTAGDSDIQITTTCEGAADGDWKGFAVNADMFGNIIKVIPNGSAVELLDNKARVVVKHDSGSYTLDAMAVEDFPRLDVAADGVLVRAEFKANGLKAALKMVAHAMPKNDARPYLNGTLLDFTAGNIVATDGHRLAKVAMPSSSRAKAQAILPFRAAQLLQQKLPALDSAVIVTVSRDMVKIAWGDSTMCAKLLDFKYPDYERVIPKNQPFQVATNKHSLANIVKSSMAVQTEKYHGIKMVFGNNALTVSCSTDNAECSNVMPITYRDDTIAIGANASYMLDAINSITSDAVLLTFQDAQSSIGIVDGADREAIVNVVMPMRL